MKHVSEVLAETLAVLIDNYQTKINWLEQWAQHTPLNELEKIELKMLTNSVRELMEIKSQLEEK